MKILMVLTSHAELHNTGKKTVFWLEEFAAPYYVFKDAGAEVVLSSPAGGQPPLDPKSDLPEFQTALTARFKADKDAQDALSQTVKLEPYLRRILTPCSILAATARYGILRSQQHRLH